MKLISFISIKLGRINTRKCFYHFRQIEFYVWTTTRIIELRVNMPDLKTTWIQINPSCIDLLEIEVNHFHNIDIFKSLLPRLSQHSLQKNINCGYQLRRTYGLACAHKILVYCNTGRQIPLESIDYFWRRLDVEKVA
uniref:Uncharacterized protein n=1 Tax=Lactuca sativa TaxID=4236 RepID=A0A9R1W043_LACSA|nr:hypothetical protein LSAT_V11C400176790 [Lactuca sativa]